MQTTLDCTTTSSVTIHVEPKNSTLTDEHIDYLYRNFSFEGILNHQIEQHISEEENEAVDLNRRYEAYLKYEKPSKSQEYIRVGKRDN